MDKFLKYLDLRDQLKQKRDEVWVAAKDVHTYIGLGYIEYVDNDFQLTAKSKKSFTSTEQSDFATAVLLAKEKLGYLEYVDKEFQLTAKSKRPFTSAEQSDFATAAFLAKEKLELLLDEEEELAYTVHAALRDLMEELNSGNK